MSTEASQRQSSDKQGGGLYFIWWDPRVTEQDIRRALDSENLYRRITYMSYILNGAEFEDIWKYLKLKDIQEHFWRIRWRTVGTRERWKRILGLLGYPPDECADPRAALVLV